MGNRLIEKEERRFMLDKIKGWNLGWVNEQELAKSSCFTHFSVPRITELSYPKFIDGIPYKYELDLSKIFRTTKEFKTDVRRAEMEWEDGVENAWAMMEKIWNKYGLYWSKKIYLQENLDGYVCREGFDPIYEFIPEKRIRFFFREAFFYKTVQGYCMNPYPRSVFTQFDNSKYLPEINDTNPDISGEFFSIAEIRPLEPLKGYIYQSFHGSAEFLMNENTKYLPTCYGLPAILEVHENDTNEQEQESFETASDKVTKTNLSTSLYSTAIQHTDKYDTNEQEQERFETASDTEKYQTDKVTKANLSASLYLTAFQYTDEYDTDEQEQESFEIASETEEYQTDKVTKTNLSTVLTLGGPKLSKKKKGKQPMQYLGSQVANNNSNQHNSNKEESSEEEETSEKIKKRHFTNRTNNTFNTTETEDESDRTPSPDPNSYHSLSLSTHSLPATHGSSFNLSPEETEKRKRDKGNTFVKLVYKLKKLFVKNLMKPVSLDRVFCGCFKDKTQD